MIRAKIAMKLQKMVAADCNQMSGNNHNQKPREEPSTGGKGHLRLIVPIQGSLPEARW